MKNIKTKIKGRLQQIFCVVIALPLMIFLLSWLGYEKIKEKFEPKSEKNQNYFIGCGGRVYR